MRSSGDPLVRERGQTPYLLLRTRKTTSYALVKSLVNMLTYDFIDIFKLLK